MMARPFGLIHRIKVDSSQKSSMVEMERHGQPNADVTRRIVDLVPKAAAPCPRLPEAEFRGGIPAFPFNGRRHVGILLGFLKHTAVAGGKWDEASDKLPFPEKVAKLFRANGIKTVCDMGGSRDSPILRFLKPLAGGDVRFFSLDKSEPGGSFGGITFVQGDGRELPKIITERPELAQVRDEGGFDAVLSNAVISPGGIDTPLVSHNHKGAITLVEGCVGALSSKPGSFALITPFASLLAFKRSDVEPFSDVKYWTKEDFDGQEFCGILRWAHGWDGTAAVLGRKRQA
jgi:hypothetical protein